MTGSRLSFFPSVLTEWQVWREEQPETLVLSKPATCEQFDCGTYATNPKGSYEVDAYASYYNSVNEGVLNSNLPREAGKANGQPKQRVIGLRLGGAERAYPFDILKDHPVVNDTLNGQPVLVWFDPETSSGGAYLRNLNGQILTFSPAAGDSGLLTDAQTDSLWLATSGEAVDGPLSGKRLPALVATPAFEFGWYGYFPDSDVYRG